LQTGIVVDAWKKERLQRQSRKKENQQEIVGTILEEKK
jgi:hypothetical protein|tara:strand:+ start:279 stop:392 length:114 start_codon:yes stop_codon:yes gene_type:complete